MAAKNLADYRPVARPQVHTHGLEAFADAQEAVQQAQALRADFLDREAKLRQAADLAADATSRADAVLYALDEKKRSVERAADTATQARSQACEVAALLEQSHAALRDATRQAEGARSDAAEMQQRHHQLQAEIDGARFDLQAFLEDIRMGREELQSLQALSRPFAPAAPGAAPGLAPGEAPGALASVPSLYPAGPTLLSFLYGLMTTGIDATTGITRAYVTNTANSASGLRGWHIDKLDKAQTTSSGLSFDVEGISRWEIGMDYDTAATGNSDFILAFDAGLLANEVQQISVGTNTAGQFKAVFNAQTTVDIAFNASAATVAAALASLSTIGGAGNVAVVGRNGGPWLVELKGTLAAAPQSLMTLAAGTTPLSGGSGAAVTRISPGATGADLMRWSPYDAGSGPQTTKLTIGAPAGTPRADTEFIKVVAPPGLSGLSVNFRDDGGTLNGFSLANQTTANRRCIVNLNNLWQFGSDYQHTDVKHLYVIDAAAPTAPTRLFLEGGATNPLVPKGGVNTASPLAYWHVGGSSDPSLYNVVQTHYASGYSTLNNRMIQFQQILDASQAVNYLWLMGTLDAASTRATPTAASAGPICHGVESTNLVMSLISAPTGTNQTINRVLGIGANALGFFDTTPVAKQTLAAAATDLATVITLANSIRTALIAYGQTA